MTQDMEGLFGRTWFDRAHPAPKAGLCKVGHPVDRRKMADWDAADLHEWCVTGLCPECKDKEDNNG